MDNVWDPMSETQTKLATMLVQRLVDDYPTVHTESKNTKVRYFRIVNKFEKYRLVMEVDN